MSEGGGGKLLIGCGALAVGGIVAFIFMISLMAGDGDFDQSLEQLAQLNMSALTEEGERYLKLNEAYIEKKLFPITYQFGIHWTTLAAILEQKIVKGNNQSSCSDFWLGPMKIKELHWSGNYILEEFPDAKTDFSHCGDIQDNKIKYLRDLVKLEDYREKYKENYESCVEKAKNEKKEKFCQAYGMDANEDQKADPFDTDDAILSVAFLLSDYQRIYGNLGQALNQIYGENEMFLRALKNRILLWVRDPSMDGIFRWPLESNRVENITVTQRFQENGENGGLTILSREGERVFAVGGGYVQEVGSDFSCGRYVKIMHYVRENGEKISTVYCHLKNILVQKDEQVEFGQEIGEIGEQSLTIQMWREKSGEDDDQNQKPTAINPEEYITAPKNVIFNEKDSDPKSDDEEEKSDQEEK